MPILGLVQQEVLTLLTLSIGLDGFDDETTTVFQNLKCQNNTC
jgi:hypothetical protein